MTLWNWFAEPVPRGRIAAFRTVVYLFVVVDLTLVTPSVGAHGQLPHELYRPLMIGRLLSLPTPTPTLVAVVFWALIVMALVAATGHLPRVAGTAVFVLYFEWMIIAMSYGKVDHDRFAFLLALALLPTAGAARHGDETLSEADGWVLRMTQIAVIATYFLAAWAKLRLQGPDWMTSSVLAWAVIRRGSAPAKWIARVPHLLVVAQFAMMAFELATPAVFILRERHRRLAIGGLYLFHLMTFLTIGISFAPHLIAMSSFLPLETLRPVSRWRQRRPAMRTVVREG